MNHHDPFDSDKKSAEDSSQGTIKAGETTPAGSTPAGSTPETANANPSEASSQAQPSSGQQAGPGPFGYGPQAGYGPQPGYNPQAGYGPQPGYGPRAGYGSQQGFQQGPASYPSGQPAATHYYRSNKGKKWAAVIVAIVILLVYSATGVLRKEQRSKVSGSFRQEMKRWMSTVEDGKQPIREIVVDDPLNQGGRYINFDFDDDNDDDDWDDLRNYALSGRDKIAILRVNGAIQDSGSATWATDAVYNHRFFLQVLEKIRRDSAYKAILIYINSPGGGVYESSEIRDKILRIKKERKIPVYVCMEKLAASGGYYIAADADKIYANLNTLTGSIGVISSTMDARRLMDKLGIEIHEYSSGDMKSMGAYYRKPTKEEEEVWEKMTSFYYNQFVDIVAQGRHLDREDVLDLADGRIYTSDQALELKLIDGVLFTEDVLPKLREECSLKEAVAVKFARGYGMDDWTSLLRFKSGKVGPKAIIDYTPEDLMATLSKIQESMGTPQYMMSGMVGDSALSESEDQR